MNSMLSSSSPRKTLQSLKIENNYLGLLLYCSHARYIIRFVKGYILMWKGSLVEIQYQGRRQWSKSHVSAQPQENVIHRYTVDIERHYI